MMPGCRQSLWLHGSRVWPRASLACPPSQGPRTLHLPPPWAGAPLPPCKSPSAPFQSVPRAGRGLPNPHPITPAPQGSLCPLVLVGIVSGYQDKRALDCSPFLPRLVFPQHEGWRPACTQGLLGMRSRISPLAAVPHLATHSWCSARSPSIPPCHGRWHRQSSAARC